MDLSEKKTPLSGAKAPSGKNLVILILAMFAAGIFLMAWGGYEIKGSYKSHTWPAIQGTITSSHVHKETRTDSDHRTSTTYYPKVQYQYQIEGRQYSGNRINFGGETGGMKWLAQRAVDRYPSGKTVRVYYDPQNPEYAILESGITWGSILTFFFGLVFFGVGVICLRAYRKN